MKSNRSSVNKTPSINNDESRDYSDILEVRRPSELIPANKRLDIEIKEKESTLAGLKAEIKSRQRLVTQLVEKNTDPSFQEKLKILEEEIMLRDRQIQVLNDRVIVLDAQLKEGSVEYNSKKKDNQINQLKEELLKANKSNEIAEEKAKNLEMN